MAEDIQPTPSDIQPTPSVVIPQLVTSDAAFGAVIADLRTADRYAIDTEFHRERTYYAQVALVQLAWADQIAMIDPLAVDIGPLAQVLDGPGVCIMHACRQDLEVLDRHCHTIPERMVDTQLMAGFLGYSSPSLASLLDRELGIRLPKADRLTDWLHRPLSEAQLTYAASDVSDLVALHDSLARQLEARGRTAWFEAEMTEMLAEPRGPRDPAEVWRRIKELRHLKGKDLAIAQAVAGWREERAEELDLTPRFVLSDLGVVGIAVSKPQTLDDLKSIRGVEGRSLRSGVADDLIAAVAEAVRNPPRISSKAAVADVPNEMRPAMPLVSAWVSQLARDEAIDAALLATRSDIESLLRGDPDARLAHGWRGELVGTPVRRLLAGKASIAFEPSGRLVLEDRTPTARA